MIDRSHISDSGSNDALACETFSHRRTFASHDPVDPRNPHHFAPIHSYRAFVNTDADWFECNDHRVKLVRSLCTHHFLFGDYLTFLMSPPRFSYHSHFVLAKICSEQMQEVVSILTKAGWTQEIISARVVDECSVTTTTLGDSFLLMGCKNFLMPRSHSLHAILVWRNRATAFLAVPSTADIRTHLSRLS